MERLIVYISIALTIQRITVTLGQDPCNTNRILDERTRSNDYMLSDSDPNSCDRKMEEGWYKIMDNGDIPTECPPILRCGSTNPIWLDGALPTRAGQKSTVKACQRGFIDCCETDFSIGVMNCGDFNVFHLIAPPACPGRYCIVGPPAPCPPGMSSETGFGPNCQPVGITFSVSPEVEPFIPTTDPVSDENELAFRCKTSMPTKYRDYFFDVAWYIDSKEISVKKRIPFALLNSKGVLHRKDWDPKQESTLGFQVMCRMRARMSSVSVPTPYNNSKEFYAGVMMEKTSFNVKSGDLVKLKIKSTVPVACQKIGSRSICSISIELLSFKDLAKNAPANCDAVKKENTQSKCGITFDGNKWNEYHQFDVHTLSDKTNRPDYTCSTKLVAKSSTDTLWRDYKLPDVFIHVSSEKRSPGNCESSGDPHITTFDKKYYTTHQKGEFVLYRHKEKPIEVHVIHRKQTMNNYAVNCAIVIRAAADVFVIYGCNSPIKWITRRLNCDSEHQYLEIYERGNGKNFEIILPTGTSLKVNIMSTYLNIYLYLSPTDWGQTEGLCGSYNGDQSDDFTDKEGKIVGQSDFVKNWKVPQSQSLFIARSRKGKLETKVLYCSCYKDSIHGQDENKADCEWKENLPLCKPVNWKENKCQIKGRSKRETEDDFEFDVPPDVVEFEEGISEFTWKNGWTEEKALNVCSSYLERSKLYSVCSKLNNVDVKGSIKTCVADIKISGTDDFMSSHLDTMKSACVNEIRTNTTFWKPVVNTESQLVENEITTKVTILENKVTKIGDLTSTLVADLIFENDCPSECSNAGKCNQGICECNEGFAGEDCAVNIRMPPKLYGASDESLCDVSKRPCSVLSFFGNGFYDSQITQCIVKDAKLQNQLVTPRKHSQTTNGSLVSFSEMKCDIAEAVNRLAKSSTYPVLDVYLVSVTFNGVEFSDESPVIIYDSRCTSCRILENGIDCRTKDDICFVESTCYNINDIKCKTNAEKSSGLTVGFVGFLLGSIGIVIPVLLKLRRT